MSDERIRVIRAKLSDEDWRALKAAAAIRGQTLQEHAADLLRVARDTERLDEVVGPRYRDQPARKKPSLADTWRR